MEVPSMTSLYSNDIQTGWKVFAGAEEIGEVTGVGERDFEVRRGILRQHHYQIPMAYVAEATGGVVDLNVEASVLDTLEVDRDAQEELPEEYLRLEGEQRRSAAPDPPDLTNIRP
jgi:hypothetical protein